MQSLLPTLVGAVTGALVGWGLTRWVDLALARLWALCLLMAVIVLYALGLIRGEAGGGIAFLVLANFVALPAFIGAVAASVLTEWRMRP